MADDGDAAKVTTELESTVEAMAERVATAPMTTDG
jgi:hypothetical protein